jgi:hypothetical protein
MKDLANKIKEEAFELLSDGQPRSIKDILAYNSISTRFNSIFGDQLVDDAMCMAWLSSFQSIEHCDQLDEDFSRECMVYLQQNAYSSLPDPHDVWLKSLGEKARDIHTLETDVSELLSNMQPTSAIDILPMRNVGSRFKDITGLPEDQYVDGLWKDWLASVPGIEFVQGKEDYVCIVGSNALVNKRKETGAGKDSAWDELALEKWLNNGNQTFKQALLHIGDDGGEPPASETTFDPTASDFEACTENLSSDVRNGDHNAASSDGKGEHSSRSAGSSITDWVVVPTAAAFDPSYGKNTKEAKQLEKDVLDMLADGSPRVIGKLYTTAIQSRFVAIFFRGQAVLKTFWKKWLASLPGVELLHDSAISSKDLNDMEDIFARRQYTENTAAASVPNVEALPKLKGAWRGDNDASTYEVSHCKSLPANRLSVKMTRPTGHSEFRKGVIVGSNVEVMWGSGFKLVHVSEKRVSWHGRSRSYEWTRIEE